MINLSIKCLHPGCTRIGYSRGNCQMHYQRLGKMVRAGRTTWAELERLGKSRPAVPVAERNRLLQEDAP